LKKLSCSLVLAIALIAPTLLPVTAEAQGRSKDHRQDHRHDQNQGRNRDQDRRNKEEAMRQRSRAQADRVRMGRERSREAQARAQAFAARERELAWKQRYWRESEHARAERFARAQREERWREVQRRNDHRQSTKNTWRNLSYLGGAAGLYGLLTGNKTIAALGLGGGLYSVYRYEQDRKSQNHDARNRYELFRRSSFDHNGHHYVRGVKNRGGQKYYYFRRIH
jgi:hypothetical protein